MIRRPALLARLPRLFWRPSADQIWLDDWPAVTQEQLAMYPALAPDLDVWLHEVEPLFRRLDHRARILQNRFLRGNVLLILGGLAATCLGAIQVVLGGRVIGLAIAQAIITAGLGGLALVVRSWRDKGGFLTPRLKAELMKSEFFLFLGRAGVYAREGREYRLRERIVAIDQARGAT